MFEISWSELLILAVVTLLFVGPKELPVFLRTIGRYAGMLRRQAGEFRAHFDEAMREAELSQMKEEMDKMQASVNAEVMGAEKVFKEAGQAADLAPSAGSAANAASFTAAATSVVFPQSTPMGQVYVKPQETAEAPAAAANAEAVAAPASSQEKADAPATAAETAAVPAEAPTPRPEVVKAET